MEQFASILAKYREVRVLVFGAAGFIGRWVSRYLCQAEARVVAVVRHEERARDIFQRYGIDADSIEADLSDLSTVSALLESAHPEVVFNLAGYGVDRTETDERLAYLLNAGLVSEICAWLGKYPVRNRKGQVLVHVGSGLEYGDVTGNLSESTLSRPTTVYAASKLAGTQFVRDFGKSTGMNFITARLFTVYGPGEHPDRLLPSLIRAAHSAETLALTAGIQMRDFTYVEDVAEGLLRLGSSKCQPGEIINLATGQIHEVRDFVQNAAQLLGITADKLNFGALPTRSEEMRHDPINIDRLRSITGWQPGTPIQEGILRTVQFEIQ